MSFLWADLRDLIHKSKTGSPRHLHYRRHHNGHGSFRLRHRCCRLKFVASVPGATRPLRASALRTVAAVVHLPDFHSTRLSAAVAAVAVAVVRILLSAMPSSPRPLLHLTPLRLNLSEGPLRQGSLSARLPAVRNSRQHALRLQHHHQLLSPVNVRHQLGPQMPRSLALMVRCKHSG